MELKYFFALHLVFGLQFKDFLFPYNGGNHNCLANIFSRNDKS